MEAKFIESYVNLSSIQAGDIAISKDRTKFFVCGHQYNEFTKSNVKVILDLNDLNNQYSDTWDMDQLILILKTGDKFIIKK